MGDLVNLVDFDIRNNAVGALPNSLESLNALENIYLHNKPICSNGWINSKASEKLQGLIKPNKVGCIAQCSIYCQDIFIEDNICDRECDSAACKYDGGDCEEK